MLQEHSDKIGPNSVRNVMLFVCIIGSGYLVSIDFRGSAPGSYPESTLIVAIIGFLVGYRTIYFSSDGISVVYLVAVYKRTIQWENVSCINVVNNRYIYIALADCPSYEESGIRFDTYVLLHPRKVIVIDIFTEKQKEKYLHTIQKYYQQVKHI